MDFDDQNVPPNHFTSYIVEKSPADVDLEIQLEAAALINNGFVNPVGQQLGPRYYTLDKANVLNLLANINAATLWNFPIPAQFQGDGTPRDGWTDLDGNKRAPPPSDKPSKTRAKAGVQEMTLLTYLKQLLFTWQHPELTGLATVPQRWLEWLQLLIHHYARYSPTEIYAFLNRVDFTKGTFKV